jgi:membrane protein DedA with SNARE-associated domain
LLDITGASIWATTIGLAGYYFGHVVEAILGDIKHYEIELFLTVIGVAVPFWLIRMYKQRHSVDTKT